MERLASMSYSTHKNIGVIGLGIIGRAIAANLRRKGFPVYVWNRSPRPVPNFVGSPGELAGICDYIQIFVSDDEALLQARRPQQKLLHWSKRQVCRWRNSSKRCVPMPVILALWR